MAEDPLVALVTCRLDSFYGTSVRYRETGFVSKVTALSIRSNATALNQGHPLGGTRCLSV
jgi:hypothetical protein